MISKSQLQPELSKSQGEPQFRSFRSGLIVVSRQKGIQGTDPRQRPRQNVQARLGSPLSLVPPVPFSSLPLHAHADTYRQLARSSRRAALGLAHTPQHTPLVGPPLVRTNNNTNNTRAEKSWHLFDSLVPGLGDALTALPQTSLYP